MSDLFFKNMYEIDKRITTVKKKEKKKRKLTLPLTLIRVQLNSVHLKTSPEVGKGTKTLK